MSFKFLYSLLSISVLMISNGFGQDSLVNIAGNHVVKIAFTANPIEFGPSVSYQYYSSRQIGWQFNANMLFPIDESSTYLDDDQDYQTQGLGFSIQPEFRFYPNRRTGKRITSFFIAAGPLLKYLKFDERKWENNLGITGFSYKELKTNNYKNFSLGLMGRVGIEGAFDRNSRNTLFESSFGFGVMKNDVKKNGEQVNYSDWLLFAEQNKSQGAVPYVEFRIAIGYRFK